ncbi:MULTISPECIES: hypothetical protein [unclassified Nonomuraea]
MSVTNSGPPAPRLAGRATTALAAPGRSADTVRIIEYLDLVAETL